MSTRCAAAILAGGRSCRPGGIDKSQLLVDGRPLPARQRDVVRRPSPMVRLAGDRRDRTPIRAVDAAPRVPIDLRIVPRLADAPGTMIVACDMPFLSLAVLEHLVERAGEVAVAVPERSRV